MPETAQQIHEAHLSNALGQDPIKIQSKTNRKLGRLIKGVPTAKLRKRPAPEKWSVAEILAHLADVEIVIGWRMRSILGDPGRTCRPTIKTHGSRPGTTRSETRTNRLNCTASCAKRISRWSRRFRPRKWKHFGQHAERGQESIEHIVRMVAGHDINHVLQIERILEAKK